MAFLLLAALQLVVVGCDPGYSNDEVARVVSPDGRLDAVLFETNGGATTSFGYHIDISLHGRREAQQVAKLYGAVRNEHAYGLNLRWTGPNNLDIDFLRTKAPPEIKSPVKIGNQDVTVTVHSDVLDSSAPSGGMLYNLKKSKN